MRNKNTKVMTPDVNWKDITPGGTIYDAGNAEDFLTGDWRALKPIWKEDKCKQCMLCPPTCPECSIPVKNSKRMGFDFDHCKGCGVCVKVCPFNAIDFVKEGERE